MSVTKSPNTRKPRRDADDLRLEVAARAAALKRAQYTVVNGTPSSPAAEAKTGTVQVMDGEPAPLDAEKTDEEVSVGPVQPNETVELGRRAWANLTSDRTWAWWLQVGAAVAVGRTECGYPSNKPGGAKFNRLMGEWLEKNDFKGMDKGDRSRLLDCLDNLPAIEKWRAKLSDRDRRSLNHPSTVWRKWTAAQPPDPSKPPKPKPVSQTVKLEALKQENAQLKRAIDGGGGDVWQPEDRAKDIARVMVEKLSKTKAKAVIAEMTKLLEAAS